MTYWRAVGIGFTLAAAAVYAQHLPGSSPRSYSAGNVLHPGGVPAAPPAGTPIAPFGGYGQRTGGGRGGRVGHPPHAPTIVIPFVPLFAVPGVVEADAGSQAQEAPPPIAVINQAYRPELLNPAVRDYSEAPLEESPAMEVRQSPPPPAPIANYDRTDPKPTIYLIALNDKSIVAALGLWVEGDTLNYITRESDLNRISLDRVDREFTRQLNASRNLDVRLP